MGGADLVLIKIKDQFGKVMVKKSGLRPDRIYINTNRTWTKRNTHRKIRKGKQERKAGKIPISKYMKEEIKNTYWYK